MEETVKFSALQLQNSITYNNTNQSAIDKTAPLPFLDWLKYFANISSDPNYLLEQYKIYVNQWFKVQQNATVSYQDTVQGLYLSLFKNISVNYLTQDEKRFIKNVDLSNPTQIATIIPIYVRKIKDICLYFVQLRESEKAAVYNYNIKGSNYSFKKNIVSEIETAFLDPDIKKLFADAGITQSDIKNNLSITFETLYDTETNYFDINPSLSSYDATGTRLELLQSNSYVFDPNLFVDFDKSIVQAISAYPVILEETGNNFAVSLDFTADDFQFLKDADFQTLVNDLNYNNLKLHSLKEALQQFSGTTFFYLSTNNNSEFKYGKLFDADSFSNYLNRRYPTIAAVESDKLKSETAIGNFFKQDKLGILNFLSFDVNGSLSTLEPNKTYVFPDPSIYGNISGLSRTKHDTPFTFTDNVSKLKNNTTNSCGFGQPLSDFLTKFKAYQSRSESLKVSPTGISKIQDPIEFFSGDEKTNWANVDVFPIDASGKLPIDERQKTLLINNNKTIYQTKSDIYGNEYSLFKEIKKANNPAEEYTAIQGETFYCQTLDGHLFFDPISGSNFNYSIVDTTKGYSGVTLSTYGFDTLTEFSYYIPCIKFFPESFYRTVYTYSTQTYDAQEFRAPAGAATTRYDLGSFVTPTTVTNKVSTFDGKSLIINDVDISLMIPKRSYTVENITLGSVLSSDTTSIASSAGTLTADKSLYSEYSVYGDLYFRNYNGSVVEPASSALSSVFAKYTTDIQLELSSKLKTFDIIYNYIICETESYITFDKLEFNADTNSFTQFPSIRNYIQRGTNTQFNHFSNIWFNDDDRNVVVIQLQILSSLSASNYKVVYPEIYYYDFNSVEKLYPTSSSSLSAFALSATALSSVNIIFAEKPVLNYNVDTGKYCIKYLAKDSSHMFYDVEIKFKIGNTVYDIEQRIFKPDMFLLSENFGNAAFSQYATITPKLPAETQDAVIANKVLVIN